MRTFRNYPESSYFVVNQQPNIRANKTYTTSVPSSTFVGGSSASDVLSRQNSSVQSAFGKFVEGSFISNALHLLKTACLWLLTLPRWVFAASVVLLIGLGLLLANANTKPAKTELFAFERSLPRSINNPPPIKNVGNNVLGSPTISPPKIDAVLRSYNSPASGFGQSLYNLGIKYGIDPAYALAFFIHESTAGTQGVAAITKSIGNIRCTAGYECYQTSGNGSFRRYATWEAGAEDWYRLIKDQYINKWGLTTLEQIIPVYAPSADRNNPTAYIRQVANTVQSWRSGKQE